ncbi:hypothetical protein [Halorubrum saccharovorum]|uniref:hypothetical protein n=1 Tax=Halorubrum saccharovorum TaxID=2248 RepID=UPI001910D261|nr:hypothetical protein [Halorubrum saccharovorum]
MAANRLRSETLPDPADALLRSAADAVDATLVSFDSEPVERGAELPRQLLDGGERIGCFSSGRPRMPTARLPATRTRVASGRGRRRSSAGFDRIAARAARRGPAIARRSREAARRAGRD